MRFTWFIRQYIAYNPSLYQLSYPEAGAIAPLLRKTCANAMERTKSSQTVEMNADQSAGTRTRYLRARALAAYHASNPGHREGAGPNNIDASVITVRTDGGYAHTEPSIGAPNTVVPGCCAEPVVCPTEITNFTIISGGNNGGDYPSYAFYFVFTWDPIPNGVISAITDEPGSTIIVINSNSQLTVYSDDANYLVTLTIAVSTCTPVQATSPPCFLAGSLVSLADGSTKPIEAVEVGDLVIGAFGEVNAVLALHRPLLGSHLMCRINHEHSTTNHHPHVGRDKRFYCGNPTLILEEAYRREHPVLLQDGVKGSMYLQGLAPSRILPLLMGVELKTIEGSCMVTSIETYSLPPETQLYNLVVGGSHTYHVDGYAVTGWPREDDFDYDTWTPRTV